MLSHISNTSNTANIIGTKYCTCTVQVWSSTNGETSIDLRCLRCDKPFFAHEEKEIYIESNIEPKPIYFKTCKTYLDLKNQKSKPKKWKKQKPRKQFTCFNHKIP